MVSELLEAGNLNAEYGVQTSSASPPGLDAMEGVETASARAPSEQPREEHAKPADERVFYPMLRGVDEDEDGDAKMPQ